MTFVKQFNSISDTVLDNLRQKADGKTLVSLFNECNRATLDAIAMVSYNTLIIRLFLRLFHVIVL